MNYSWSYGADVCSWWVGSLAYDNDIKIDMSFFDVASESYRKVRNTVRFLLGNIGEESTASPATTESIDGWVLAELTKMSNKVIDALQGV